MATRVAKKLNNILTEKILHITEDDITLSFVTELFGEFDGKVKCNPYDELTIPINTYGPEGNKNKTEFITTVGLWIFNKFFFEKELTDIIYYINEPITKKITKKIDKKLSYALLEDDITQREVKNYLNKTQKIMPYVTIISPSQTNKLLLCTTAINKEKKRLEKQYEKELAAGDIVVVSKIEKELLDFAKDYLKDDPSADVFNSGARGSWENNFKNMYISKGAIKDPDPDKGYAIVMDNYSDGISKENYVTMARSLSAGPYARAVKTSEGGYKEKLLFAGYQHIILDKEGSDCGSDKYITVPLTKANIEPYMYMYMKIGSQLIELNSKNMSKYIDKTVKFRYPSLCKSKTGICNKCAGNLFYKLGLYNVGMLTPDIASNIKNKQMKNFHDSVQKVVEIDPMRAFGLM